MAGFSQGCALTQVAEESLHDTRFWLSLVLAGERPSRTGARS